MLTPAELAAHIRASERTVARMVIDGCPSMLAGHRRRFDLAEVTAWMQRRAAECRSEETQRAAGMQRPALAVAGYTDACRRVQVRAMPSAPKLS